jgi:hypothetical protein
MNQGTPITLTDEQRIELERWVRTQTLDARSVRRARIVLLAAEGVVITRLHGDLKSVADK